MRSEIENHAITDRHARAAVVQTHPDCLRRDEAARTHDQVGAAGLVKIELHGDHVAPARQHSRHVRSRWSPSPSRIELRGEPGRRPLRSKSCSCWEGSWCSGRSRRSICARRRRCDAPTWPCAKPAICRLLRYQGPAFHNVPVGTSSTSSDGSSAANGALNANARSSSRSPITGSPSA